MSQPALDPKIFDAYAAQYDAALQQGLAVSGETKDYFARGRITWLMRTLRRLGEEPRAILDFGCGTGTSARWFRETLPSAEVLGVDVSTGSLEVARRLHGELGVKFSSLSDYPAERQFDLAFCNGVFHHIPPAERPQAVSFVVRALRPGGLFAFCENNPWNPGTRIVMSRIPFDRDAIPLSPPTALRLLRAAGLQTVRTDFLFVFPRPLKWLRGLEPLLCRLPLGAQYQILCRKPAG